MKKVYLFIILTLLTYSCNTVQPLGTGEVEQDDSDPIVVNNPPSKPLLISPKIGTSEADTLVLLQWTCNDVDLDTLVYTVYFGEEFNPSLYMNDLKVDSYMISGLEHGKRYYWRVAVSDAKGAMVFSEVYSFKTTIDSASNNYLLFGAWRDTLYTDDPTLRSARARIVELVLTATTWRHTYYNHNGTGGKVNFLIEHWTRAGSKWYFLNDTLYLYQTSFTMYNDINDTLDYSSNESISFKNPTTLVTDKLVFKEFNLASNSEMTKQ